MNLMHSMTDREGWTDEQKSQSVCWRTMKLA